LERIREGALSAEARIVISDVEDAGILQVAEGFGVPNRFVAPGRFRTKMEPGAEFALVKLLQQAEVELLILAGFMRVLKQPALEAFPHRILNIHPSLLPKYPGLEAWKQVLAAGENVTGCTVHFVDAGVDSGQIIAQREVPVLPNDTPEALHERIQQAERILYPEVIAQFCR
jgi:phosphoribosylglycinamide formyltransferase 1